MKDAKMMVEKIVNGDPLYKTVCPRCGKKAMNPNTVMNALSRYADVMICDACGTDEALRDYVGLIVPLEEWAMFMG